MGVGGQLMYSRETAAREQGFKLMQGIALAGNYKIIKFAQQLGFTCNHDAGEADMMQVELQL